MCKRVAVANVDDYVVIESGVATPHGEKLHGWDKRRKSLVDFQKIP